MNSLAPVYIVDDDHDDREFLQEVWEELKIPNQILFFNSSQELLAHLNSDKRIPFMIMSDVNLPIIDGFALRKILLESPNPNFRSVPFIFWSNSASSEQVQKAFDLSVHGFFLKESSLNQLKQSLNMIIQYWTKSLQPTG